MTAIVKYNVNNSAQEEIIKHVDNLFLCNLQYNFSSRQVYMLFLMIKDSYRMRKGEKLLISILPSLEAFQLDCI